MKISVVMSVWNGAPRLGATLDSILAQTEDDFELIVVDDGSTDATPQILFDYARRDERVRILTQRNTGLTRALIRGCEAARGTFIARHDAADQSHPERFRRQLALMDDGVVLVACTTQFVGPNFEDLYVVTVDPDETRQNLLHADAEHLHGIAGHGSAMFRRDAYERAGGYRAEFRLAQDLDLWIRLAKIGRFAADPGSPLFTVVVEPRSLSTVNHDRQTRLKELMVALRDGGPAELLSAAAAVEPRRTSSRRVLAPGYYFIGRCLRKRADARARSYFKQAVAHDPFHLRAWISLLSGL